MIEMKISNEYLPRLLKYELAFNEKNQQESVTHNFRIYDNSI